MMAAAKSFSLVSLLLVTACAYPSAASAQGQEIEGSDGSMFMEEQVSARKDPPKQKVVMPVDLSNVGISTDPEGHIIPRLHSSSQPVQPMYSTGIQQYNELPAAPFPGGTLLYNPYGRGSYGANGLRNWLPASLTPYGITPVYPGYYSPYMQNGVNFHLGNLNLSFGRNPYAFTPGIYGMSGFSPFGAMVAPRPFGFATPAPMMTPYPFGIAPAYSAAPFAMSPAGSPFLTTGSSLFNRGYLNMPFAGTLGGTRSFSSSFMQSSFP